MSAMLSNRWVLLFTVAAGLLLITLDNTILYTALPTLTRELGADASQGLWMINAYPLVMAGLLLGAGTLGDHIGHRRMFLSGLVIFGVASVAAAFSPGPEALIAARAVLAVGAAAMMPATLALIRIGFADVRERNFAIAVWGSVSVVGAALGPIIGGALLEVFWWGSVFLINVPVVIVAIVATLIVAPADRGDTTRPWDVVSSILALVTLSALVVGIKEIANVVPSVTVMALALAVSLAAGTLFVVRQRRLDFPLLDFSIFRNAAFSAGVVAAALVTLAIGGLQLVTTQRFQLVAGFSPMEAGLLVSAIALGALPTALLGGALLHRVGLLVFVSGGLALASAAVLVAGVGLSHGLEYLVAAMMLAGAGLGAVIAVASTAIVGNAPANRAGMASSVEEVSYEFGNLLAVALFGSLIAALYGSWLVLPVGAPEAAREGLYVALTLAEADLTGGPALVSAATAAFDEAYLTVLGVIGVILAFGSVATGVMLRRYGPGTQASAFAH